MPSRSTRPSPVRQTGQTPDVFKAERSNDGAVIEISFLVSASSIPQNLSLSSLRRRSARGSRQLQTWSAVLLSPCPSGPDVPPPTPRSLGWGVKCQLALMQSQRAMDRETLGERKLSNTAGPWGEGTDSHHGNLIF